jgi:DNA processing protein
MRPARINTVNILTLLSAPGVGRRTVQQILSDTSTMASSRPEELRELLLERADRRQQKMRIPTAPEMEKAFSDAERVLESADHLGVQVIGPDSPDFPEQLRDIPDPPVMLYARGNVECLHTKSAIAVIGTREPSPFGQAAAEKLGARLATKGIVVVSGLAIGCDSAAHSGCLRTDGKTVAVLAHGLDQVYPAQNRDLASRILDSGGCLMSEYPPGSRPRGNFFVERDRLQSGLCAAVIVVETDVKGGTMHTARFCLEQGRLLGCVVHPTKFAESPKAQGNKMLMAEGKALALSTKHDIDAFVAAVQGPAAPKTISELPKRPSSADNQMSFFSDWAT